MNYYHILPSAPQLIRLGTSAMNQVLATLKSIGVEAPKANAEFDIDNEMGFLPSRPLHRLPEAFDFWERALSDAASVLSLGEDESPEAISKRAGSEQWRARIREGPLISIQTIENDHRSLQRAHLVLAYLTHYYVHSIPPSSNPAPVLIPRQLSIPLVAVSRILGIAPVLTYADTVLWNAYPDDPQFPMSPDNMRFQHLFSGSDDEDAFYRASASVELKGAELLQIIEEYNHLPDVNDINVVFRIKRMLFRVAEIIDDLNDTVMSVRAGCDPHVFYYSIRPWYRGADADGPTSPGWIYEGVEESHLDLSGPSAGQSSVFHTIDVWLDIDHKLKQRRYPAPSEDNKKSDLSFMERMRRYMPGPHREFLQYVQSSQRPIRGLVRQTPALKESYNTAVMALKKFRDCHIRVATLYVVSAKNRCPMMAAMANKLDDSAQGPVRGTGGTELATLLKAGRDATRRAILPSN